MSPSQLHSAFPPSGREARVAGGRVPRAAKGFWHQPDWMNLVADTLILLSSIALGYALVTAIVKMPVFGLREVILLDSPQRVTLAQLEFAAQSSLKGNFFTVDLEQARRSFETLPWVRQAQLRRRWPAAIEVALEEHVATAYWESVDTGETSLINAQGELFDAAASDALPVFSGPAGTSVLMLAELQHLDRILQPMGRKVRQLRLSSRLAWQVVLDDGMLIELGKNQPKSPVEERLARFVAAWPAIQTKFDGSLRVADLRYPSGFAARLKPGEYQRGTK